MSYLDHDFPNTHMYDSDLRELIRMYHQLRGQYSGLVSKIEELNTLFTTLDKAFKDLEDFVTDEIKDIEEYVENLGAMLEDLSTKVTYLQEVVASNFTYLKEYVDNGLEVERNYVDSELLFMDIKLNSEVAKLQKEIDDLIFELPEVYNIVKGYKTDIVTLIYDVYDATRDNALTAGEWDVYGATAGEFDSWQYTALELDTQAKSLLIGNKCRNPFTGELDTICNIIQQLAQATTDQAITAEEYDEAELTAEEFEALNLTAYMYDFFAKQFIGA